MAEQQRDHLFISYATEDGAFAEWLTLRLTSEGYRVWCDRVQLLGGESYPRDIDAAIKDRAFRVLAVLSRSSISKPNPLKERTLALNLGHARKEQFLIPLNLDGVSPPELDWMMSDITFVPFHRSWAAGLTQLLKLLERSEAPKALSNSRSLIAQHVGAEASRRNQAERLWTNVLELADLPRSLLRVSGSPAAIASAFDTWPHHRENDRIVWVFELPPGDWGRGLHVKQTDWTTSPPETGRNVVVNLLRQYLDLHCLKKGLQCWESEKGRRRLFFTDASVPSGWLGFVGYDGLRSRVKAFGERSFRTVSGTETTRYHLAPSLRPILDLLSSPSIVVRVHLHLTDAQGTVLPVRKAIRRRKAICKSWWNYEWLARVLAVCEWFTGGKELNLALTEACSIRISPSPWRLTVPVGIDEGNLAPTLSHDEPEIEEDEEEQDEHD